MGRKVNEIRNNLNNLGTVPKLLGHLYEQPLAGFDDQQEAQGDQDPAEETS